MKGLPSDDDTWRVGQTIADLYEVRGINREGGMAIVYFVWHEGLRAYSARFVEQLRDAQSEDVGGEAVGGKMISIA